MATAYTPTPTSSMAIVAIVKVTTNETKSDIADTETRRIGVPTGLKMRMNAARTTDETPAVMTLLETLVAKDTVVIVTRAASASGITSITATMAIIIGPESITKAAVTLTRARVPGINETAYSK
jgi:hypothetical protein